MKFEDNNDYEMHLESIARDIAVNVVKEIDIQSIQDESIEVLTALLRLYLITPEFVRMSLEAFRKSFLEEVMKYPTLEAFRKSFLEEIMKNLTIKTFQNYTNKE